jgi:hypothetical protein
VAALVAAAAGALTVLLRLSPLRRAL